MFFYIPEIKFNKDELNDYYLNNNNDWALYGPQHEITSLHTKYADLSGISSIVNQFKRRLEIIENVKFLKQ